MLDAVDRPIGLEVWFYTDWKSRRSRFCNRGWTSYLQPTFEFGSMGVIVLILFIHLLRDYLK
jgi:hypothetical protein